MGNLSDDAPDDYCENPNPPEHHDPREIIVPANWLWTILEKIEEDELVHLNDDTRVQEMQTDSIADDIRRFLGIPID